VSSRAGQLGGLDRRARLESVCERGTRAATVGLDVREREIRVWYFDVLLGASDPRTQDTVEPIVVSKAH
jgi:hypothetical protein